MGESASVGVGSVRVAELEYAKLLHAEYLKLYDITEDYERRCLTIKSWLGLGLSGVLALGSVAPNAAQFRPALWTVIIAAAAVWWLEALWRTMQWKHVRRVDEIEAWMRNGRDPTPVLAQLEKSWRDANINWAAFVPFLRESWGANIWEGPSRRPRLNAVGRGVVALLLPYVFLPYAPIIAFALFQLNLEHPAPAIEAPPPTELRCMRTDNAAEGRGFVCSFVPKER